MTDKEIAIVKDLVSDLKKQLKENRVVLLQQRDVINKLNNEIRVLKDPKVYELEDRVELELKLLEK